MSEMTPESVLSQIIAKCWTDANYKAQLLADPAKVLKAEGLNVPTGLQLVVLEDSPSQAHWVIPVRPSQLSDDELEDVAAGAGGFYEFLKKAQPIAASIARTPAPRLLPWL